jgi:hypothetical protein
MEEVVRQATALRKRFFARGPGEARLDEVASRLS